MGLLDLNTVETGQRISLVVNVICTDLQGVRPCHLVQSGDRQQKKMWLHGNIGSGSTLCLLDGLVTSVSPLVVSVDDQSQVHPIPPCRAVDLSRVVELCSGLGAFTSVLSRFGLTSVAGVDENKVWQSLFSQLHGPGSTFIHGDIHSIHTLQQLIDLGCFHAIFVAGVSCQPHSRLGDLRSMMDERAQSLPKALHTAWLLQSVLIVLECVPGVLQDGAFQQILRQFVQMTGYRMSQGVLKLSDSWCSRRDRWICTLVAPLIGPVSIPPMPSLDMCAKVRDLFGSMPVLDSADLQQLQLNLYELGKHYSYACGGIERLHLQLDDVVPTLLHSAGNALYICACGCRQALSEQRLQSRGLVGVLIQLGTFQRHMGYDMEHCRYLHPTEMWAALGGKPDIEFGPNLRLAMAGVGQCVAPLMAVWVFAHVRKQLDFFLGVHPPCNPDQVIRDYATEVRWPDAGTSHVVRFASGVTGHQLLAAEKSLSEVSLPVSVYVAGLGLDLDLPLQPGMVLDLVLDQPVSTRAPLLEAPVVSSVSVEVPDWHVYAVSTFAALDSARKRGMSQSERAEILGRQGPVWSDDELLFGLRAIAHNTDQDQHVSVWDPLLISGLLIDSHSRTWSSLVGVLGSDATVISAVVVEGHWYPLVWRMDSAMTKLFTCGVAEKDVAAFNFLSSIVGVHRSVALQPWNNAPLDFLPQAHCGALVLDFVRHLLWGHPLPQTSEALEATAASQRALFLQELPTFCLCPGLAALGLSPQAILGDLLTKHGVPADALQARIDLIYKNLGEATVSEAVQAANPWQELKWHANQLRPPMMLIKPSELQTAIDRRSDRTVGQKKHKKNTGKGVGKGSSFTLDPTALRLEFGTFHSQPGAKLAQVTLSGLNSSVSGVVLANLAMVQPFLSANAVLSTGALAFLVLEGDGTNFVHHSSEPVRVPLVCAANSEPLLVDGWLVQVGAIPVIKAPASLDCAVQSVPTCVVKAMIYRDQTPEPWSEVTAHPMRHIFDRVPPLQVCSEPECLGCECWHASPQYPISDPVVEVWSKQWLRLNFVTSPPAQAELYAVNLRLPEVLQHIVQEFSGFAGIFLEPKSVDGRKPSALYQVVWLPRATMEQLAVQRQTIPEVCGLARLGTKLGLRCKTEHAAEVFQKTKPGVTYLPAGRKQTWLVGPFPWGTLMHSVAAALKASGWVARPIQPVTAGQHVEGLLYKVQSVSDPPAKVLSMKHGDVVVTQELPREVVPAVAPKVVATPATKAMISRDGVDDLQVNDPWARPGKAAKAPAPVPMGSLVDDMEQKVLQAVMEQLPKQSMEVDQDAHTQTRVQKLEQQVSELHSHTTKLQQVVQQHASDQAAQYQDLQQQITVQGTHFEQAIASHAGQLHTFQESFQEQFRQQVTHQQAMLDGMFQKQMSQFESLLAKRHKPE
eukprot:s775_g18.t1